MTAFADLVSLLRLEVNIYHNAKVCGDWVINEHHLGATCFHVVTQGRCFLDVPDHLQCEFNEGDMVIFPRELAHSMVQMDNFSGQQLHLGYDSHAPGTGMLCGEVQIMHRYQDPLLAALPKVLLIKQTDRTPWLGHLVALIIHENQLNPAATAVTINRLCELLFVYALRHYLDSFNNDPNQHAHDQPNPPNQANQANQPVQPHGGHSEMGILALYGHPKVTKAIKAFHQSPANKWDLSSLAQIAGMSRTVFSATFKQLSGWTVNQYTHWWRMQIAYEQLQQGDKVIEVALAVGYHSEAAFSRAFTKQFAISAGQVRRITKTSQKNSI